MGQLLSMYKLYMGKDDGFEFFGGTVNTRYLVSTGSKDDSFDWTYGWQGKGQFWLAQQAADGGDRGIEADNNNDNKNIGPFSEPTLSNITIRGNENSKNRGIKFRAGTKGYVYHVLISGFPKGGVAVEHNQTLVNLEDGSLVFANSLVNSESPFTYTDDDKADYVPSVKFEDDKFHNLVTGNITGDNIVLDNDIVNFDNAHLQSWFIPVDFIGAVSPNPNNDWTTGWTKAL